KADGPVTIELAAGTYYLSEPLVLGADDSGTDQAPITYTAAPGAKAVVSGGTRLDLKWRPYKGAILQADVPAAKDSSLDIDVFFADGGRQRRARYPNYDPKPRPFGGTAADAISPERVRRGADPIGAYVHALHRHEWGDFHYRVTGSDAQGNLTLEGGWQN